MYFLLEVIAFTIESCHIAERAGAHRIELCDNAGDGGTTPSYGMIKAARAITNLQLYPMIRPRGGDFLYSDEEYEIMRHDIQLCKELGCDGVVLGLLKKDGTIDVERTSKLVGLAYPMGVTFHRAFDRTRDHRTALEDVIKTGCERILTSGLYPTAIEGLNTIKELVSMADERIIIMPGSGIRSSNVLQFAEHAGAREFHTSGRVLKDSKMEFHSPTMKEKLISPLLDEVEVKEMISFLQFYASRKGISANQNNMQKG
jgi:copper homeostasis protein